MVRRPLAVGGGRFLCLDRGGESTEVLSKQVSVVSLRRQVSSSMSFFPHLKYKHIQLSVPICHSVHHLVSQDLSFKVTLVLGNDSKNEKVQICLTVL